MICKDMNTSVGYRTTMKNLGGKNRGKSVLGGFVLKS